MTTQNVMNVLTPEGLVTICVFCFWLGAIVGVAIFRKGQRDERKRDELMSSKAAE